MQAVQEQGDSNGTSFTNARRKKTENYVAPQVTHPITNLQPNIHTLLYAGKDSIQYLPKETPLAASTLPTSLHHDHYPSYNDRLIRPQHIENVEPGQPSKGPNR